MNYNCDTCKATFLTKQHKDRHMKTKKHQIRQQDTTLLYSCNGCKKTFIHASGLSNHKVSCKHLSSELDNIKEELKNIKAAFEFERASYKEQIERSSNNITNIDKQNNIHIHINAFGQENLDYLTDKIVSQCVHKIYDSIPTIIEKIHFDPKHPENHNVRITNKKLPHASVIGMDNKWRLMNKEEAISSMVENGYSIIDNRFKEDPTIFSEERRRHFRSFQDNFSNDEKETMKRIKTDVELVILNGTKGIMSSK